jgi:hypothetical protein
MDSLEKLESALTMVTEARSVPLSGSCVLHRGELLDLLNEIKVALPSDLYAAGELLASRDRIIDEGRTSAEQLIAHAREEVARMVEQTAIVQSAREESSRILDETRAVADAEKAEVDQYIDSRLATLEVILNKTLEAINRGRDRLAGSTDKDVLSELAD